MGKIGQHELAPILTKPKCKGKIQVGNWYHLKRFIDDQLQVETKLERIGDLDVYKKGEVGIWAWETKASFDDFKVYGPGIEGSAVEPQKKLALTWGRPQKIPLNHNLCCIYPLGVLVRRSELINQIRLDSPNTPLSQVKRD